MGGKVLPSHRRTDHLLSRRTFIGASAGAGIALTAGATASAPARGGDAIEEVDVVVIGAGFAGLNSALQVMRAGRSVRLLEARDRVGGRVLNHALADGRMIEAGGQFVGPTQNRIYELASEFGVGTFDAFEQGKSVASLDGGRGAPMPEPLLSDFRRLIAELNRMSREVPVDMPWTAPRADEWDATTLHSWLAHNAGDARTAGLFNSVADLWGAQARDVSLLFALYYIAAAGDAENPGTLDRLLDVRNGAQEQRLHGGSHVLAQKIADTLGDRLTLSSPVRRIRWTDSGRAEVATDLRTVHARRVIVALPPALAGNIQFEPALPTLRMQLMQRLPMGSLIKVLAVYDAPFWREDGLSGISMNTGLPVHSTFDNSLPGDNRGIILGFVSGDDARAWAALNPQARRQEGLRSLAATFGERARDATEFLVQDWPGDQWSRGGPVGFAAPGVLHRYGPSIREPVGPIHWAGTETATFWNGYMEGALQSGDRAAAEALAAL